MAKYLVCYFTKFYFSTFKFVFTHQTANSLPDWRQYWCNIASVLSHLMGASQSVIILLVIGLVAASLSSPVASGSDQDQLPETDMDGSEFFHSPYHHAVGARFGHNFGYPLNLPYGRPGFGALPGVYPGVHPGFIPQYQFFDDKWVNVHWLERTNKTKNGFFNLKFIVDFRTHFITIFIYHPTHFLFRNVGIP